MYVFDVLTLSTKDRGMLTFPSDVLQVLRLSGLERSMRVVLFGNTEGNMALGVNYAV